MKTKCLICKNVLPPKYSPTMERTCPGLHSELAQYNGYFEKGKFLLLSKLKGSLEPTSCNKPKCKKAIADIIKGK